MTDLGGPTDKKKRRFTRGHPRLAVSFPLEFPDLQQSGITQNFGAGGLVFLSETAFEVGQRIRVICANPHSHSKLALDAEVVASEIQTNGEGVSDDHAGAFTVRVKFVDLHPELQTRIRGFIAEWLQSSADDKTA
jgi:hypothetical protein